MVVELELVVFVDWRASRSERSVRREEGSRESRERSAKGWETPSAASWARVRVDSASARSTDREVRVMNRIFGRYELRCGVGKDEAAG